MSEASDTTGEDAAARFLALEQRLSEVEATAQARVIRAELKAEAVRAGMIDLDGLKLIDTSAVKLTEAGEVEGGAALMKDLKRAKPWLFGAASSSSTAAAPPARASEPKLATEMTEEEWRAARADLIKRR